MSGPRATAPGRRRGGKGRTQTVRDGSEVDEVIWTILAQSHRRASRADLLVGQRIRNKTD